MVVRFLETLLELLECVRGKLLEFLVAFVGHRFVIFLFFLILLAFGFLGLLVLLLLRINIITVLVHERHGQECALTILLRILKLGHNAWH